MVILSCGTKKVMKEAGSYYVQEASSMFVEQAVKQHLGEARVALDLCAAPGGKSTLLRSLLPDECVLVSNEVIRPRAQVLAENITKWGHPRCMVTSNYPADFTPLGPLFDLILVDATSTKNLWVTAEPCGEGSENS